MGFAEHFGHSFKINCTLYRIRKCPSLAGKCQKYILDCMNFTVSKAKSGDLFRPSLCFISATSFSHMLSMSILEGV